MSGTRGRGLALALGGTAALALAGTAAAWACVPQPRLVVVTPQASGAPGSQVTVQGIGFDPPPSRVEVRWNTSDGQLLATSDQANFSLPVTVPQVAPGL